MTYLLSAIGANLIMTFLMRYSEHHNGNRYALNIWNYLSGALISIRKNGAPLTTTFNRLGILIPTILSAFLFREIPSPMKIMGLCLCIFAILIMNTGDKKEQPSFMTGLILVFILGGTLDFISRVYSLYYNAESQNIFVLYTFFSALMVSIVLFIKDGNKMSLRDCLIGIGVGLIFINLL